jgi:hypothetical protein
MYADIKNLVTTGIGNLIDPIEGALRLPWKHSDTSESAASPNSSLASQSEIRDAWNKVKSHPEMNKGGGRAYHSLTSLRLSKEDIRNLVASKVESNERILRQRFPGFDSWPADAQLGLLSMAWAAGPVFKFPKFIAAASMLPPDFNVMAKESFMPVLGKSPSGRNAHNALLFTNAANVLSGRLDPEILYFPIESLRKGIKNIAEFAPVVARKGIGIGGVVIGGGVIVGLGVLASRWLGKKR